MHSQDAAAEKSCKISTVNSFSYCCQLCLIVDQLEARSCILFLRLLAIELIDTAARSETSAQFKVDAKSADKIPFWLCFCGDGEELDGPAEFFQSIVGLSCRITIHFASSASFSLQSTVLFDFLTSL